MLVFLQQPIVVEVAQQPAETARITYSEVILSAFGVAAGVMVTAALVGIAIGLFVVYRKKRNEASGPDRGTDHVRLGI